MKRISWLAGSALACLAGPAWATDADIASVEDQAIAVTATRIPGAADEVPATVTVIDEGRIADELATDARDLIRFEPGVSVPRSPARFGAALGTAGRDGNSGFTIRGIGGNRVLIQVDGIRVPDGFSFGAQLAGRGDYVDLGIVKSVEILRGPASALYGSDGLAGAVSFQTSDPADLLGGGRDTAFMLRAGYDSASDEFSETALAAGRSSRWSGLVSYTRRDGHELDNEGSVGGTGATRTRPNPQDTSSNAVLGKILFAPNDDHVFRLTAEYGDGFVFTDVLSGRSTTVLDLYGRDTTERRRLSLDWRYSGGGAIESAQVAVYWQEGENRQLTAEDRNPAVDRTRFNTFDNRVLGASVEAHSSFATGTIRHDIVFGGDLSVTRQEGLRDGTVPPAGEVFPTRAFPVTDFLLGGLFVGDRIAFGDNFLLFPALRFDHSSLDASDDPLLPTFQSADQSGSRVTPRIGLVWTFAPNVSLFANYAQGFKSPAPVQVNNFFENLTSAFFSYRSIPNPDLRPETSETFEAGLRYQGPVAFASLTGFVGRYDDFISQEQIGTHAGTIADPIIFQFVNLERVEIEGIEGRAGIAFPGGFNADFAFAWATGHIIDPTGAAAPLSSIEPLKIVAGVGWHDPGGRFGAQLHLTAADRKSLGSTAGLCTPACFRPAATTLFDLTAFWRINENFTLRAGLFNITDEKYAFWSDVAGLAESSAARDAYTQPGRNARISLTTRF